MLQINLEKKVDGISSELRTSVSSLLTADRWNIKRLEEENNPLQALLFLCSSLVSQFRFEMKFPIVLLLLFGVIYCASTEDGNLLLLLFFYSYTKLADKSQQLRQITRLRTEVEIAGSNLSSNQINHYVDRLNEIHNSIKEHFLNEEHFRIYSELREKLDSLLKNILGRRKRTKEETVAIGLEYLIYAFIFNSIILFMVSTVLARMWIKVYFPKYYEKMYGAEACFGTPYESPDKA